MDSNGLYEVAVFWLCSAVISSVIIFLDIRYVRPQSMKIMMIAWPVNALYFGLIGLFAYYWFGRGRPGTGTHQHKTIREQHCADMPLHTTPPAGLTWKNIVIVGTHCGAGCTLADITGGLLFRQMPVALAGHAIPGAWAADFLLALVLGICFQYLPARQMGFSFKQAFRESIQAELPSLIAWQAGMYFWMAIAMYALFTPDMSRLSVMYWFMMQLAMICGFITAYPVNRVLCERGMKHIM